MHRVVQVSLLIIALVLLINTGLAWLLNGQPALAATGGASTASFLLLLPLGVMLINLSAMPLADRDTSVIGTVTTVWGVAIFAYFGVGFAFQFGGLAIGNPHIDFADLYWNWTPLETADAEYWGVVGLRGWALLGAAGTAGIYDLFIRHLALVGIVSVIPAFLLHRRVNVVGMILFGLLVGALIYPIAGNWVWSSGWLSQLGRTLGLGHGFVDAGMATPFVLAGMMSLAILRLFPTSSLDESQSHSDTVSMPAEYLPYVSLFGLTMIIWGWTFIAQADHLPTAPPIVVPRTALNGLLALVSGGLLSALYSRFVTGQFDLLMLVRGAVAGLVALSTVAPFVVPWQAIAVGLVVGLVTPLLIYFVDHTVQLSDHTAAVAIFGLVGGLAWLLPGVLADGTTGIGWNGVGTSDYMGVQGQGVSGLFVQSGYGVDWPGQFNAQLVGAIAIIVWTYSLTYGLFWLYRGFATSLRNPSNEPEMSNLEQETTVSPTPSDDLHLSHDPNA
ncbi:MAG: hypothetical protein AAF629_15040 [Chloroflexota bacterium]